MRTLRRAAVSACLILLGVAAAEAAADANAKPKPITTARGKLGDLLREWHKEGTAAGNVGDWYDNRDRGHSGLRIAPYPQLQKVTYTAAQLKSRADWAMQRTLLPHVVFGNSSTSGPPLRNGSNVRSYYSHPRGLAFLYMQYRRSNLYIYPEHRDHDPGHNGTPGYGDLYPTNTPYLIASQGSSGSDQPFMRAVPFALAAFRPEVKKKLIEAGLLMPTVQMILRTTSKHLADPKEYLSGKAHPTVFVGRNVDALKMVQMAHGIQLNDIPPILQLKVVKEDVPVNGRDYSGPRRSEKLADTPAVIARIVRGTSYWRKMTVSAEASVDINKRPLTFHWVVLRGDAAQIKINPANEARSAAEIAVPYHPRRPIAKGSAMESNRVDIGVFVHNGKYYSAPGFVTFFYIDSEARTYDVDGRLLEIGYGVGTPVLSVSDWPALFKALEPGTKSRPAQLLKKQFSSDELAALRGAAGEYAKLHAAVAAAEEKHKAAADVLKAADVAMKQADKERAQAQKAAKETPTDQTKAALAEAEKALAAAKDKRKAADGKARTARGARDSARRAERDMLAKKRLGPQLSANDIVQRALRGWIGNPKFIAENREAIETAYKAANAKAKAAFDNDRTRLIKLGIIKAGGERSVELQAITKGPTRYQKAMLERFHASVISGLLYPGLVAGSYKVNHVDPRIAAPKAWRDVYHYDARGNRTGWTRYDGEHAIEFSADGLLVLDKDAQGRCIKARTVRYQPGRPPRGSRSWNWTPMKQVPGNEILHYEYDGKDDRKGRVKRREAVGSKPKKAPSVR